MRTSEQNQDPSTTSVPTMKAVIGRTYGPPDALSVQDVPRPSIGDGDVLLRVRAAGLDQGVWHTVTGLPFAIRAAGFGLRAPKNPIPGFDVAGVVAAVGRDVTRFQVGDEAFGTCAGSFAQYAVAPQDTLAPKPPNVSFEQAAAVPSSGTGALQALRDLGQMTAGHRVLVIGAGGGVGTFAVQIAKAFGAEVTGVCSSAKVDLVRSIGADDVIDYTLEDITARPRRYDLVIDTGGDRSVSDLRATLAPTGTLVIVGGEGGGRLVGLSRQLRAMALSPLVGQRLRVLFSSQRRADLERLAEMLAEGSVVPVLDRTFALHEVPDAIRRLRAGSALGKIVVLP